MIMTLKSSTPLKVIYGEDWSVVSSEEDYTEYFNSYYDMPTDERHSPFNLGVYFSEKEGKLKSSQYVGIMPLIDKKNLKAYSDNSYISIHPRFKSSAIDMLTYVLKSDDFYENNETIIFKDFDIKDIANNSEQFNKKKNKILFGRVSGVKEVNTEMMEEKDSNIASLVKTMNIFGIWDFVSKARVVCQKMLKHQSEKVEKNFTGKVKGRIDLQKQIKLNLSKGRIDRTYCVYNKLTIDNIENRILKYALHLCEKEESFLSNSDIISENLAYCKRALSSVRLVKCTLSDFRGIKNNGVYRHYKPVIEAAKMIIKGISVSFAGEESYEKQTAFSKEIQPFFIDMNVLFELYSRAIVSNALKETNPSLALVKHEEPYSVISETVGGFISTLIPDIIITKNDKPLIVIDAKYSNLETNTRYNREKTHQIMAYMLLLDCKYGGFISPKGDTNPILKGEINPSDENKENKKYGFSIGIDTSKMNQGKETIKEYISKIIKNNEQ